MEPISYNQFIGGIGKNIKINTLNKNQIQQNHPKKVSSNKNNLEHLNNFNYNNFFTNNLDNKIKTNNQKTKKDSKKANTSELMIDPNKTFEQKLQIFKLAMKSLKTDWTEGACTLELTRENLLDQSVKQLKKLDLYKVNLI